VVRPNKKAIQSRKPENDSQCRTDSQAPSLIVLVSPSPSIVHDVQRSRSPTGLAKRSRPSAALSDGLYLNTGATLRAIPQPTVTLPSLAK